MPDEQDKPTLVTGQFPTARASGALVFHVGGTFVVSWLDERLVTDKDGKLAQASFEVSRYALGPITALWLANNLLTAMRHYVETVGELPKNVLPSVAPFAQIGDAIAALEDMLKQSRQQPPEEPPKNEPTG